MSTITAPIQDVLPFDVITETAYGEQARQADRELCQRYFRAWCGSVGNLDGSEAGHEQITFEQFEAAAARLAAHAKQPALPEAA